ncbi:MAG TPA: hypothetical protein VHC90_00050 [Bryobacteraceae bacterium]|jgi:hypothetical protein|nr:hypothetical protein [Bryobacteraceae bacterium]
MSITRLVALSKKKLSEARVSVAPSTAAWWGLPLQARERAVFHPYDVEQAVMRSAELAASPVRRIPRKQRSAEPQEVLARAFHFHL